MDFHILWRVFAYEGFIKEIIIVYSSPFAQFYPGFVKLWQNIFFAAMETPIHITRTERVDDIPLLLAQMDKMNIAALLNKHFPMHGNWQGLLKD